MTLNRTRGDRPGQGHPHDPLRPPGLHAPRARPRRRATPRSAAATARTTAAPTGAGASTRTASSAALRVADGARSAACDATARSTRAGPPPPLRGARARVPPPASRWPTSTSTSCRRSWAVGSSRSRPGLVRFRRRDYLGDPAVPLRGCGARAGRASGAGARPRARSACSRTLRTLGHCFNPVSFYYCFAAAGETLEAVVAEVTNTPWGERHAYVLAARRSSGDAKALHVSPFMRDGPALHRPRARAGRDAVGAHREPPRTASVAFDATLGLKRRPLTPRSLLRPLAPHAADARADLRPRGRAEAQGRPRPPPPGMIARAARPAPSSRRIASVSLTVIEDDRATVLRLGRAPGAPCTSHDPRASGRSSLRGSRGLGETYVDGLWDTPDLTAVIRVAARNVGAHRRHPPPPVTPCASRSSAPAPRSSATRRAAAARTSPPTTTSATTCSS